jgi:hypothetical protein
VRKKARLVAALALIAALTSVNPSAEAQVYYTINGQPASPFAARYMAANGLPPGHYWLNAWGYWGVAGNPIPLGNINAARGAGLQRPGLSQRGMLYRPGEILNGR